MKKDIIRRIIGGVSLTSALFVFQACYGTPQDAGRDILVEGTVTASNSGLPIKGIQVSVTDVEQSDLTDEDGGFSFYVLRSSELRLVFSDVDSTENGRFQSHDTLLTNLDNEVYIDISLDAE